MPDATLPLSPPVFHVLLGLGDEVLHGYAIMQRFEALTGGEDQLLPGTLYATLSRMVEGGLIEEAEPPAGERSGGAPRRHYRVTETGRRLARAEGERMHRLVDIARRQDLLPESVR